MMNFGQIIASSQSLSANDHPLHHDSPEPDFTHSPLSSSMLRLLTPPMMKDHTADNLTSNTEHNNLIPINVPAGPLHFLSVSHNSSSSATSLVFGGSLLHIDSYHAGGGGSSGGSSSSTSVVRFRRKNRRPLCSVDITANPLPEDLGVVKHAARLLALFIESGEVVERWTPSESVISPCECPPGAIAVGIELPMVLRSSIAGAGALVMLQSILNPEDSNIYQVAVDHPMVSHPFFPSQSSLKGGAVCGGVSATSHIDVRSQRQFTSLCALMDIEQRDIPIDMFLCGLLTNIPCTWETYIITLALFYRVSRLASPPSSSSGMTKVLLLGCYVLAVKSRDDQPYSLCYYAKAVGIPTSEVLHIELCVWQLLDYNAGVSCDDYITTLFSLRTFCSKGVHLDEESWFQDAWGELLQHIPLPAMSDLSREIIASVHDEAMDIHGRQYNNNSNTNHHPHTTMMFDIPKSIESNFMQASNGVVPVWQVSHLECYCPHHNHQSSSHDEVVIKVDVHDS